MMARFLHGNRTGVLRKYAAFYLACFWVLGLVSGLMLDFAAGDSALPLMREAVLHPVSGASRVVCILLPLLISLIAVFLDQRWMIYICAYGKALLLCFFSVSTAAAFGSSGWLVRVLLLFSDTMMCGLWYLFWLSCLNGTYRSAVRWISVLSGASLIIGIDYWLISPLLMRIFIF